MNARVVAAIAQKDIVDAVRNRYLLVALLTPLLVAILFRLLLPGAGGSLLTIVVHDPANSRLVSELRTSRQIKLVEVGSPEQVPNELEQSKAIGGLAVPANFDTDVTAGRQPELTIYINNKRSAIEQATFKQLSEQRVASLVKQPPPARLTWIEVPTVGSAQPGTALSLNQMLMPLLLLMTFGMSGALVVPLLLVEEKEKRTLDFLLTSPASLKEIIAAKALTGVVYSLLIAAVLLVLNRSLVRNWPLTILTVLLGMSFVVALGLFMGSLLQNTMQVNTWAGLVLFAILAPGFPTLSLPAALETGLRLIPTYYFVEALKASLSGTVSARNWLHLSVLLACTVLAFFAATWGLRRRLN
jgi:ABC-2 type transport system permease protein